MLFSGAKALGLTTLITSALASHGYLNRAEHHALAQRAPGTIAKRDQFNNARYTFFDTGLGACGIYNKPSDFIVALNQGQYEQANHCFKMITITANGKTAQAQITDECPGCPWGGLDMTTGLFDFFADPSVGVVYGSWHFNDGSGGGSVGGGGGGGDDDPTTTSQKPSPTSTKSHTPTSTYTPPPPPPSTSSTSTSSTSTKKTTTSSSSSSTSSSSSSSTSTSTKPTTTSKPTSTSSSTQTTSTSPTPTATEIAAIMQAVLGMAQLGAVGRA